MRQVGTFLVSQIPFANKSLDSSAFVMGVASSFLTGLAVSGSMAMNGALNIWEFSKSGSPNFDPKLQGSYSHDTHKKDPAQFTKKRFCPFRTV